MNASRFVTMPKLGLTMTEGTLVEWMVAPGDRVAAEQLMFVVETDKTMNEIQANQGGIVKALLVEPGTVVYVGAPIAEFEIEGEGEAKGVATESTSTHASTAEPVNRVIAENPTRSAPAANRLIATPLSRRIAAEAGLDLASVCGSGPRGRIVACDVEAALGVVPFGDVGPNDLVTSQEQPGDQLRELGPYQRVAARRLIEAKRDIPHFYVFGKADVTELLALREQVNGRGGQPRLTVNHFLIAAVVRALAAMPQMNRVWAGDALREFGRIDVGIAVEGPQGLVAPVLRDLGTLGLHDIALAAIALVERARAAKLTRPDVEGGAIAISNVGMFGATALVPIINPGQSSILGVGASQQEFRPDEAGKPVLRQVLMLALSCDHRVVDGALAARFLRTVCGQLENAAQLLRPPNQGIAS